MKGVDVGGLDPACTAAYGGPFAVSGPAIDEGEDPDLALARVQKGMGEGVAREWRGSQAVVPIRLARVQTRVARL